MKLGTFKVVSGNIHVSDPCYKKENCFKAENGIWQASSGEGKDRVSSLTASTKGASKYPWQDGGVVGVDSGQMSIFDTKFYRDDNERGSLALPDWMTPKRIKAEGPGEVFYGACCTMTNNEKSGGVLPHGAVSTSGYGDGTYGVRIKKNEQGKVVAVSIKF